MEKATAVPSANARVVQIEIRQAAVARKVLGIPENISNAADCVDQRMRGVMVDFATQTINMDVHDVGCRIDPHPPHVVENHGSSHYSTFVAAKIFQKRKFLWGQLQ
jgi:hypothetical protein